MTGKTGSMLRLFSNLERSISIPAESISAGLQQGVFLVLSSARPACRMRYQILALCRARAASVVPDRLAGCILGNSAGTFSNVYDAAGTQRHARPPIGSRSRDVPPASAGKSLWLAQRGRQVLSVFRKRTIFENSVSCAHRGHHADARYITY